MSDLDRWIDLLNKCEIEFKCRTYEGEKVVEIDIGAVGIDLVFLPDGTFMQIDAHSPMV